MNLLKRIGNIFMKMVPRRKPVGLPDNLVQPEKTKVAPIRDIEDLIKSEPTKSPYFSPIKTRNQREAIASAEATSSKLKLTSMLASQAPVLVKNVVEEKPKKQSAKESKKTKEMKAMLEELEKLPELEGPIEVSMPEPVTIVEPAKAKKTIKPKRVPKESPKVAKIKQLLKERTAEASRSTAVVKKEELLPSPAKQLVKESAAEASSSTQPVKEEELLSSPVQVAKRKSNGSPKSPEVKQDKWEPSNWTDILENIRVMRASVPAPVDTMGCDRCSDETADEKTRRFHILLALMLSSQTKDEVTHDAMKRLRAQNNCTPRVIADMESEKLETLLYPVSFYKTKAKYLKNTSQILIDQYDSDIPNDIKELIKLPGVGPKMAHICMNAAWDIVTGIGVDVHVHRISNRLGWVRKETKQPEQTRKQLETWLPSDYWKEVNHLLVGFGQTICTPLKPKCAECLNKAICPGAFAVKAKKVKTKKVIL